MLNDNTNMKKLSLRDNDINRIFLIHGWDGNPDNNWFPWLRKELEMRGYEVIIPTMPDPGSPDIKTWVSFLREQVGMLDENTYFIGHSIGCQAIMRMLEEMKGRIGGMIFVAGFFNLPYLKTEEEKEIAKPWLSQSIDTKSIKDKAKHIVAIFSDDDQDVPLTDAELFEKRLDAKIIVKKGKGHFDDETGVKELPIVLQELLNMT